STLGPEFRSPIRSSVPVLFIAGTLDGRTPVSNADEVRRGFPHGEELVLEGASHGWDLFYFFPRAKEIMLGFLQAEPVPASHFSLLPFRFDPLTSRPQP